jgi:putative hydrolase of the HAD superfamily
MDELPGLALFDLDHTLLDREAAFWGWATMFADEFGLPDGSASLIEVADGDGFRPRDELFEWVRQTFEIDVPTDELLARYHCEYPTCFTVPTETVDAIRRLRSSNWKVGVVTNGPPSQMRKLETTRLVDEFDAICISAEIGAWKPDPAIFEEAARRCGTPLKGWLVGDSEPADIAGGHGVGLQTIWMSRGRTWTTADRAPDATVTTISEAVAVILEAGEQREGQPPPMQKRMET